MAIIKSLWSVLTCFTALSWGASMRLPSYPLAVKTPYLSVWLPGHLSHDFPSATPQFWEGQHLTWIVLARVGGSTYCLLGCPESHEGTTQAKQTSLNFTSTHTLVSLQADTYKFNLDFFSPVDPDDHVRQSLPYSYLTISAISDEGSLPDFEVFTAIDASWLSARGEPYANFATSAGSKILSLDGKDGREFSENRQMALWGEVVLATKDSPESSCQVGSTNSVLSTFIADGQLTGEIGMLVNGGIAACSQSITTEAGTQSATFAVGLQQDQEIQYNDGKKITPQAGYWRSKFLTVSQAVEHFLDDFEKASAQSAELDTRIRALGEETSTKYSDILEFTVRQSFAGMQVTIPYDTLNTSVPYAFIKEISTDGNVNTLADLIPKALPVFHILNPEYTRMFLEPVLRFSAEAWPLNHAVHDIGKNYPNATGERPCIEEFLPLDSTTVLLWMVYLHQRTTGHTEMAVNYAPILKTYADYCVNYGLYPILQRSSVDAIGSASNQSALSISAAIALNAYGHMTGQANYSDLGLKYAKEILEVGRSKDKSHFLAHYIDDDDSWVTTYPLAFDALMGLETFDKSVHKTQSKWYAKHAYPYGVQFNRNVDYTLMEFSMWAAAVSSKKMRDHFVNAIHMFLNRETGPVGSVPGPTQWKVTPGENEGKWTRFSKAKSVIGSNFMIAAVKQAGKFTSRQTVVAMPKPRPGHIDSRIADTTDLSGLSKLSDVPFHVPHGASKPIDPMFLGLSFETAYFPAYMGNTSQPNAESRKLIENIFTTTGSLLTIRIGSPEADHATYDPSQDTAVDQLRDNDPTTLSLGPSFFDSVNTLARGFENNIEWLYQIPFASFNTTTAVNWAKRALEVTPPTRLSAMEIGHEPNLYAGGVRADNYGCQLYADEFFKFKVALRRNIGRMTTQFQALGLYSGEIDSAWSLEECLTAGINAQDDLQKVAVHYSQLDSHQDFDVESIPRHNAVRDSHKDILPNANYVRDIFPCFPFIISEASLVSTSAKDHQMAVKTYDQQTHTGVGLWNLDLLLYSMSQNISRVYMHQSCDSASSAWIPESCPNRTSTGINGPYYALTFMASFIQGSKNFRVVPIQESDDYVVYAGYESGKLTKLAVLNLRAGKTSEESNDSTSDKIKLKIASNVVDLEEIAQISLSTLQNGSAISAEPQWSGANQVPINAKVPASYIFEHGMLSIPRDEARALLLVAKH